MTRINSNTVDTTTTNSSMEEEMELLKNLISIEQRLQNLKRRSKYLSHTYMAAVLQQEVIFAI